MAEQTEKYEGRFSRFEHVDKIVSKLMDGEDHLSYSSLSAFMDSPRTFIDYKTGDFEETEAMLYGQMLHCLVLEPADFDNRYYPLEDGEICDQIGGAKPRATKAYKEWVFGQQNEAKGRKIVKTADYQAAQKVAKDVRFNRASSKIMELAPARELKIEWNYMNFKFKGFIDMRGQRLRADLKSMPDAAAKKAQRQISEMLMFVQQAMYRFGDGDNKTDDAYIIAVDKKGGVSVHELHQRYLEYGMELYERAMIKFHDCILKDRWYESYDFWSDRFDGMYSVDKPAWI